MIGHFGYYYREAWKALGDSSPSPAMQEHIAVVKKLDPSWNPQSPEKKGKEAKMVTDIKS